MFIFVDGCKTDAGKDLFFREMWEFVAYSHLFWRVLESVPRSKTCSNMSRRVFQSDKKILQDSAITALSVETVPSLGRLPERCVILFSK